MEADLIGRANHAMNEIAGATRAAGIMTQQVGALLRGSMKAPPMQSTSTGRLLLDSMRNQFVDNGLWRVRLIRRQLDMWAKELNGDDRD